MFLAGANSEEDTGRDADAGGGVLEGGGCSSEGAEEKLRPNFHREDAGF